MRVCSKCGLDIPTSLCYTRPECKDCGVQKRRVLHSGEANMAGNARYLKREKIRDQAKYEVWQEYIAAVPKDYHTLTEEEWNRAVDYFGGLCAFCQENKFVHRGMFMLVDQGGRYCDWNVVPICETCIVKPKDKNPFSFMNTVNAGRKSIAYTRKYNKKKLTKIIEYLEPILLKAIEESNSQQVQGTSNESVNN